MSGLSRLVLSLAEERKLLEIDKKLYPEPSWFHTWRLHIARVLRDLLIGGYEILIEALWTIPHSDALFLEEVKSKLNAWWSNCCEELLKSKGFDVDFNATPLELEDFIIVLRKGDRVLNLKAWFDVAERGSEYDVWTLFVLPFACPPLEPAKLDEAPLDDWLNKYS